MLRVYGGQLSKLVSALRSWAESKSNAGDRSDTDRPDADLIQSYVSATFGPHHHLTSLFRYLLCARGTAGEQRLHSELSESQSTDFDPHQPYQLGSHVRVLSDLHDCGLLIERIENAPDSSRLLDESETGERGACLMSISEETATGYQVDAGVEAMLDLFGQPRSCIEVADIICEMGAGTLIEADFFAPLVNAGIIVACERAASVSARAAVAGSRVVRTASRIPASS